MSIFVIPLQACISDCLYFQRECVSQICLHELQAWHSPLWFPHSSVLSWWLQSCSFKCHLHVWHPTDCIHAFLNSKAYPTDCMWIANSRYSKRWPSDGHDLGADEKWKISSSVLDLPNRKPLCNKIPRFSGALKFEKLCLSHDWGLSTFYPCDVVYFKQPFCLIINPSWSGAVVHFTLSS